MKWKLLVGWVGDEVRRGRMGGGGGEGGGKGGKVNNDVVAKFHRVEGKSMGDEIECELMMKLSWEEKSWLRSSGWKKNKTLKILGLGSGILK